jgi:hypothetical protein
MDHVKAYLKQTVVLLHDEWNDAAKPAIGSTMSESI